jgi:hypothetical protein
MYSTGDRVKMKAEGDLLSTPQFANQLGTVMEPRDHMDRYHPREDYTKVTFDRRIRGRDWWWVPDVDLEPAHDNPTWEV